MNMVCNFKLHTQEAEAFDVCGTRAADRVPVAGLCSLADGSGEQWLVNLRNISISGFGCETPHRVKVGAAVKLTIGGVGDFEAVVKWHLGMMAGARFLAPLGARTLLQILLETKIPVEWRN